MSDNVFVLSFNRGQMDRMRASLSPKQYEQAMYSGLRKATRSGKTLVSAILRDYSLAKKKFLDQALSAVVIDGNPPSGKITISKFALPLSAFKLSVSGKGVRAQMTKDRGPQWFSHAFAVKVSTKGDVDRGETHEGHKGIFVRGDPGVLATRGPNAKTAKFVKGTHRPARFTLKELHGPSAFDVANRPRVRGEIADQLRDTLASNIEKAVNSQLLRFTAAKSGFSVN